MTKQKIIFFGNGPLADYALQTLSKNFDIIFHAREKSDLKEVKHLKTIHKDAYGILTSFGVIIKQDILDLFEPEGILNIHPSLLPEYRGPSPIETAILDGKTTFGVSIMKLIKEMDAGPIYYQTTQAFDNTASKDDIYRALATLGAEWLNKNLIHLPAPAEQSGTPTFTEKFDKSMSLLEPDKKSASELYNQIRAFSGFPKSKYQFFGLDCIIISAHVATAEEAKNCTDNIHTLYIQCHDGSILIIDQIQPAGRKIMDAKSFLNGYKK